ncbi:hypothetical protein BGX24_004833, partial [Mortierella sp. AD032]
MTDNRLRLFCLVNGEATSNAFPIEIESTKTIGDLKELIKTKKANDFQDVDADKLTLWRVSISVADDNNDDNDDDDEDLPILLVNVLKNDKKRLKAVTQKVTDVFGYEPAENTIHIIVQRPIPVHALAPSRSLTPLPGNQSDQPRPPSPANIRADFDEITVEFFNPASQYITFLDEFVQGFHDLPVTEGNISGLPCVGKRGCGKTRTAVDLLSRSWGLYFNAGAADYGSSDMHTLAQALSVHSDIYVSKDIKQNTERIRCLTYGLLYTRLLILEHCLNLAGGRNTFSCQRWMLLQVAAPAFRDIFQELFQSISEYLHSRLLTSTTMNSVMVIIVQEQFRKVQELLRGRSLSSGVHFKFLVILDESQFLGRLFSEAFFDSDMTTVRPVLAPVLFAFRRLADGISHDSVCVMPCGTGLSSYALTWSGGSASGAKLSADEYKASRLSEMVVDFAGWTDLGSISNYLDRLRQGLDNRGRRRLDELVPEEAIRKLFRRLRGRFRPIISTIEDIINADDPMVWEE